MVYYHCKYIIIYCYSGPVVQLTVRKTLNVRVSGSNSAFSVFLLFHYYFFYLNLFIHILL